MKYIIFLFLSVPFFGNAQTIIEEFKGEFIFISRTDTIPCYLLTKAGVQEGFEVKEIYSCLYDSKTNLKDSNFQITKHFLDKNKEKINNVLGAKPKEISLGWNLTSPSKIKIDSLPYVKFNK